MSSPSPWKSITTPPGLDAAGTMLLLTDGSVLVHDEPDETSRRWFRYAPDAEGRYETGAWTRLADGPNSPTYFACAVLRDGRVLVAGGEYDGSGAAVESGVVSILDPHRTDHSPHGVWTRISAPRGWEQSIGGVSKTRIGDAPGCLLPDGRFLLGNIYDQRTAIFDPGGAVITAPSAWQEGPDRIGPQATEETWVLLGDGTVVTANCVGAPASEKYLIDENRWVSAGPTGTELVHELSSEIGSGLALPDGRAVFFGATGHSAFYRPGPVPSDAGVWEPGPDFPKPADHHKVTGAKDTPACLLPNGKVLCVAATYDKTLAGDRKNDADEVWGNDVTMVLLDPAPPVHSPMPSITPPPNHQSPPYSSRLLLLPTGQVLHANCTKTLGLYTPDGQPDPDWLPTIVEAPATIHPGQTFTLRGRQLNGLSQAVSYGDEGTPATNYPIVRLRRRSGDAVTYCRTFNHSTMAIRTGTTIQSTTVAVPPGTPPGDYELVVVANGIPSASRPVQVG